MHPFPHHYSVSASAAADSQHVVLESARLPRLVTASPKEFDGPGDQWSPEAMLVGAIADCFSLSFRAVATASKLPWTSLACTVNGTLDRVDNVTRFTAFDVNATLTVPPGTDVERAQRLLEKAERICLITNSLSAPAHLHASVEISEPAPAA